MPFNLHLLSAQAISGAAAFDYSTHNGEFDIQAAQTLIRLRFSKASEKAIHLMRCAGTPLVARALNYFPGTPIDFNQFDSTSNHYTIGLGEVFLAKNDDGYVLAGRITHIADDRRGAPKDEVVFKFSVFSPGQQIVAPAV
jgi:hypothetical protein